MVTETEVTKMAHLSRLKISDAEKPVLAEKLSSILGLAEQLKSVDTTDVEATCFMQPEHDPYRDDREVPSLSVDSVLMNSVHAKGGFFSVPKVIG